ncbi:hypothetical protein GCM10010393_14160 [Streptomyces gobitricini]|uniref:Uncharacterized protein n=1 Tax=Streptomyces gobitricini TaxID=68211 RepID=A0ABP5YS95_9ACTN
MFSWRKPKWPMYAMTFFTAARGNPGPEKRMRPADAPAPGAPRRGRSGAGGRRGGGRSSPGGRRGGSREGALPPDIPLDSHAPLRFSRFRYLMTVIRSAFGGARGAPADELAAR